MLKRDIRSRLVLDVRNLLRRSLILLRRLLHKVPNRLSNIRRTPLPSAKSHRPAHAPNPPHPSFSTTSRLSFSGSSDASHLAVAQLSSSISAMAPMSPLSLFSHQMHAKPPIHRISKYPTHPNAAPPPQTPPEYSNSQTKLRLSSIHPPSCTAPCAAANRLASPSTCPPSPASSRSTGKACPPHNSAHNGLHDSPTTRRHHANSPATLRFSSISILVPMIRKPAKTAYPLAETNSTQTRMLLQRRHDPTQRPATGMHIRNQSAQNAQLLRRPRNPPRCKPVQLLHRLLHQRLSPSTSSALSRPIRELLPPASTNPPISEALAHRHQAPTPLRNRTIDSIPR